MIEEKKKLNDGKNILKGSDSIEVTTSTKYQRGQPIGANDQYYDLTQQRQSGDLSSFRATISQKGGNKRRGGTSSTK